MQTFAAIKLLIIFSLSFSIALLITPFVYKFLIKFNLKKRNIRSEKTAPVFYQYHKNKSNTPTMGGIIIWLTVIGLAVSFFILNQFFDGFFGYLNFVDRGETYLPLAALFLSAVVGLVDDLFGIYGRGKDSGGLNISQKLFLYSIIAAGGGAWFYFKLGWSTLYVPFIGNFNLGWWYLLFFIFIIVATAFSANETDGLDGLAGGVLLFAFVALTAVAFITGKFYLATFNSAVLGAILAFLWFNIYPAKFFMGDTGSMSLGITLGITAMLTNTALLLPFFGFVLVLESGSVIIQVLSKKIRKKKIFNSTPIHHHFESLGWPESQVTMRFWIISAVVSILGLVIFILDHFA